MSLRIKRREKIVAITTRQGWFQYYVQRYCKTRAEEACHMALWYLLLWHALEDDSLDSCDC